MIDPFLANDDAPQNEVENSFVKAKAGFELFGQLLHAYTPSRKVAAQSMGMLFPFVGEAGQKQMEESNTYPGLLKDLIICLWLCQLKDASEQGKDEIRNAEWNPSRALARPAPAFEASMVWAEEEDLMSMTGKKFQEALQVFMAIVTGVAASEFRLKVDEPEQDESTEESAAPKV